VNSKMIQRFTFFSATVIGVSMPLAIPVRAQQQPADSQQGQQPSEPIPAIRSPLASAADNGDAGMQDSQTLTPDTRPLTGVEDLSLGTMPASHSYWQPHFAVLGTVDSNPQYSSASSDWSTWTSLIGGVDIHHVSGASNLALSYTGGGMFSNGGQAQNGIIQELAFNDRFTFRRSTFAVFEQLAYLPESSFGFAGTAGSGLPGGGGAGPGLGNGFNPGQTLLTPRGQNLSSSTAVEFDTKLTPRASLTFVGDYSLLRYFDEPLANSGDASFQAGYNYQVTRKDTIAVSYLFSAFRYSNLNQSINANTIQGSYGRRITGRLAFQIAAGPQFVSSTNPITASETAPGPTSHSTSALYWTLNASLQYQLRRASLAATYNHGVSGGSGLLAGAETDVVSASIASQVSRTLNVGWNVGYSKNKGFSAIGTTSEQDLSYWFTGANVAHPVGRSLDVFLNYQLQYQSDDTLGCSGTACSPNVIRNTISFGVNFHKQPIPF
jgi:hypothetical protein